MNRVFPVFYDGPDGKGVDSVEQCIAGCRSLKNPSGFFGYNYAGLEFKTECYCGDEPVEPFDELYTWPDRCNFRCGGEGAFWENCGGAGAMNVWSVPNSVDSDLDGVCVYDHPSDGRVFNGQSETGVPNLTIEGCHDYCFNAGHGLRLFGLLKFSDDFRVFLEK